MDDSDKIIQEKIDSLGNLNLEDQGLLRAKESHQIIMAQMDIMTSLFKQQHKDIEKLTKSSGRLEKLTYVLIGFTGVLLVATVISIKLSLDLLPK